MPRRRLRKRQGPSKLQKVGLGGVVNNAFKTAATGFGYAHDTRVALNHAKSMLKMAGVIDKAKTKTKTQKPDKWSNNSADGIKYKNVNISYKRSKIGKLYQKLSEPGQIYEYQANGGTSNQGQQSMSFVGTAVQTTDYLALYNALNPVGGSNAGELSKKLLVKKVRHEIEFQNAGGSTCEFDLYILLDKATSPTVQNAGNTWDNAIAAELSVGGTPTEAKTDLWTKPTSFKKFNIEFWSKRLSCTLTPGENCKLTFNFNPNRMLDTQYLNGNACVRGITHSIIIVQRGTLGDSSKTKAIALAGQTITPSKIVWLIKRTYFGAVLGNNPRVNQQKFASTELPTALTSLWTQDEDGGIPEDQMADANYA